MDTFTLFRSVYIHTREEGEKTSSALRVTPSPEPPSLTLHALRPSPCDVLHSVTYHIDVNDRLLTD